MKNKSEKLARIGVIANFEKSASRSVVTAAAALIARANRVVAAEQDTARMAGLHCEVFPNAAALARQVDLLLVFGGDGTMLRAVREIDGSETPVLGINVGRLGFLTAVSSRTLPRPWKSSGRTTSSLRPVRSSKPSGGAEARRFACPLSMTLSSVTARSPASLN